MANEKRTYQTPLKIMGVEKLRVPETAGPGWMPENDCSMLKKSVFTSESSSLRQVSNLFRYRLYSDRIETQTMKEAEANMSSIVDKRHVQVPVILYFFFHSLNLLFRIASWDSDNSDVAFSAQFSKDLFAFELMFLVPKNLHIFSGCLSEWKKTLSNGTRSGSLRYSESESIFRKLCYITFEWKSKSKFMSGNTRIVAECLGR